MIALCLIILEENFKANYHYDHRSFFVFERRHITMIAIGLVKGGSSC